MLDQVAMSRAQASQAGLAEPVQHMGLHRRPK
jgi:hypothetical protein